jgi:hypothetical protein
MLDLICRKSWQFGRVVTAGTAVLLAGLLLKIPGFDGIPGWYWPYRSRQALVAGHTIFWIWVPLLLGIAFILLLAQMGRRVSSRPDLRITLQIMLMSIAAGLAVQVGFAVLSRTYFPWVLYNFYDFLIIGLGFPLFWIFSHYLLRNWDSLMRQHVNLVLVAYLATVLCLNLSGVVLAEVARIWLFMLPFPVPYAARSVHALLEKRGTNEVLYMFALQYMFILVYELRLTMIVLPAMLH